MKFMMLMIPKIYQPDTPAAERPGEGFTPPADAIAKMMKYNAELAKAGVLVSIDGLHPIANGARVSYAGGKPKVTDGPFTESKEVIGGYWVIHVASKEAAVEWARRIPANEGDIVEVRQVFEMAGSPAEAQNAAEVAIVREHLESKKR